jgi:hypothetical protein
MRGRAGLCDRFISRGDIEVGFTLSGGRILADGNSADPAIWRDWIAAWHEAGAPSDELPSGPTRAGPDAVDMHHGYRALQVFLDRNHEPVNETPMSHVRTDCEAVFDETAHGAMTWERWLDAIAVGDGRHRLLPGRAGASGLPTRSTLDLVQTQART